MIQNDTSNLDKNNLVCVVTPTKLFNRNYELTYENIFHFWKKNWKFAFSEIKKQFSDTSEEFCRHETAITLWINGQVIGCVLMDRFNICSAVHTQHQYFLKYPESVIEKIRRRSRDNFIQTVGYLTIDQNYRQQPGLTDLILAMAIKYFLESSDEILVTYTRNLRKTNELTFRLGAKNFAQNILINNEPSDFVYFDASSEDFLQKSPYNDLIEKIWKQRILILSESSSQKPNNKRKNNGSIGLEKSI